MNVKNMTSKIRLTSVAVTGAVIIVTSGAAASIATEDVIPSGSICVTAKLSSAPEISSRNCYIPQNSENIPSGSENENEVEDTVYAKINVGNESMTIWQSEVDHSNKNKELMAAGKADEMTLYPGDNWKIIQSNNEDLNEATQIYYAVNPEEGLSLENAARAGDKSIYLTQDDGTEYLYSTKNGSLHSYYDKPAKYDWNSGFGTALYYTDGVRNREGDKPSRIDYNEGNIVSESYAQGSEDNLHRTKGPAFISYNKKGEVSFIRYRINNEIIKTREDWISKGGEAEGWDSYDQSKRIDY